MGACPCRPLWLADSRDPPTVATCRRRRAPPSRGAAEARDANVARVGTRGQASSGRSGAGTSAGRSAGASPAALATITAFYANNRRAIWRLAVLVGALVTALGVYGDVGGVLGSASRKVLGLSIGWGRVAVPAALGALVASRRHRQGDKDAPRRPARISGGVLIAASVAALLHITAGRPQWGDPATDFEAAGGYIGYAFGAALTSLAGVAGAAIILIALGVGGVLAVTGTPPTVAGRGCWNAVGRTGPALRRTAQAAHTALREAGERTTRSLSANTPPAASARAGSPARPPPAPPRAAATPAAAPPPARVGAAAHAAHPVQATPHPPAPLNNHATTGNRGEQRNRQAPRNGSSGWRLPALSLLNRSPPQQIDNALINARGVELQRALAAHGVTTALSGVAVGPTVSRYELTLGAGVKVARVTSLTRDIAYALASPDVRILAPIPGRQAIGVEVPNPQRQIVTLGDILSTEHAAGATHPLDVAVGRDIGGQPVMANLGQMPHILIAGATGAGKSSCINSVVTTILMRCTPDEVRLILVDPKMVEMRQYANVPHLLTQPVTDPKKAVNALRWAVGEMQRRYETLSRVGCRDIASYNETLAASRQSPGGGDSDSEPPQRLPFIVIVVDELSDLMMVAPRDVEDAIWRLAQMARAVGVHLVIATQRPSTNVITGVIKANIPTRLALSVSSLTDSRVILDQAGAERLVGHGDMLLVDSTSSTPQRIQGAWVSEEEIRRVTAVWRRQNARTPGGGHITEQDLTSNTRSAARGATSGDDDELLRSAAELVVGSGLGSTSMLQRKLRVGFARAGRLMDLLEQRGIVGPSEGPKARAVLVTPQEFAAEHAATGHPPGA